MSDKIRSGYRIFGRTLTGESHCWYAPSLKMANDLAKGMCNDLGGEYDVMKYIGSWRRKQLPAEFIKTKP